MSLPALTPPTGAVVLRSAELEAWVLPYGARLMQLWWLAAPEGPRPLTLSFADEAGFRQDRASVGAVCGRYANRLADAQLNHAGQVYALDANHPLGHCIHGGREGTGQQDWRILRASESTVELGLSLPDGHMGFPGDCQMQVIYRVDGARLVWEARATVNRPCPINLVQHSYWNLDGQADLRGHRLHIPVGSGYWPTNERELPTQRASVEGTYFDFRAGAGFPNDAIDALDGAVELDKPKGLQPVATLSVRDLHLRLSTDRPYLHLYASRNLRASAPPQGVAHQRGAALCLETEDLPNGPALGADVWYGPGRDYTHTMVFEFSSPSAPSPAG